MGLELGSGFLGFGFWFLVFGFWFLVFGFWFLGFGFGSWVLEGRVLGIGLWVLVSLWGEALGVWYYLLAEGPEMGVRWDLSADVRKHHRLWQHVRHLCTKIFY